MKYATKMMVVPYVPQILDSDKKFVTDLDIQREELLKNKELNTSDKVNLYNNLNLRYLESLNNYKNKTGETKPEFFEILANEIATKTSELIKDQISVIKSNQINNTKLKKKVPKQQIVTQTKIEADDSNETLNLNETFLNNDLKEDQKDINEENHNGIETNLQEEKKVNNETENLYKDITFLKDNAIQFDDYSSFKPTYERINGLDFIYIKNYKDEVLGMCPNGIDLNGLAQYMKKEGNATLESSYKSGSSNSTKGKLRNQKFLQILGRFKNQSAKGIIKKKINKPKKKWLTKKFF